MADDIGVVGAGFAYLVAGIHLAHPKLGLPRLVLLTQFQSLELLANDPRPVVFVISGVAIILGVPLAATNHYQKPIYVIGILLMLTYISGYFAWHLSGHGGFLPGREPLYHGLTPVQAVVAHLGSDSWAAVAIVAEMMLIGVLAVLYLRET